MNNKWADCPICGRHVKCGRCGNNCCNGGTGTLPDGTECGCESAYALQDKGEPMEKTLTGAEEIVKERQRQKQIEGWTSDHDTQHQNNELAFVAAAYASPEILFRIKTSEDGENVIEDCWPDEWDSFWDKRKKFSRRKQLIIAGALIAAEIDRQDRMAAANYSEAEAYAIKYAHVPENELVPLTEDDLKSMMDKIEP